MRYLILLLCVSASAQNWAAKMYSSVATNDPYIVAGGPTNWIAEWQNVGTNTVSGRPAYVFVGNDAAKTAFINARIGAYQTWRANTFDPADNLSRTLITSNKTWLVQQRDLELSNVAIFATNRAVQTTLTLSNQMQSLSRLRWIENRIVNE